MLVTQWWLARIGARKTLSISAGALFFLGWAGKSLGTGRRTARPSGQGEGFRTASLPVSTARTMPSKKTARMGTKAKPLTGPPTALLFDWNTLQT